ncbi:MAG: hypothetical protein DYG89_31215 [Caldilinea sp. CFX5]|nr:hypothetical protein [Caldilinea sp. CFX5]
MRTHKQYASLAPYWQLLFGFIFLLFIFIPLTPRLIAAPPRQHDPAAPPAPTQPQATPAGLATSIAPPAKKPATASTPVCVGMTLPTVTTTQPAPPALDDSEPVSLPLPTATARSSTDIQAAVAACIPLMRVAPANANVGLPEVFPPFEVAPVTIVQKEPYTWVVHVITKFKDNTDEVYHCTGFLLDWKTVGTAAHCVFRTGEQADQEVEFIAVVGFDTTKKEVLAKVRHTWKAWTAHQNYSWDFALLDLGSGNDNGITKNAKFSWKAENSIDFWRNKKFRVAGYPCTTSKGCTALYHSLGDFDNLDDSHNRVSTLLYARGTVSEGQSGSGAFLPNNTVYAVLSHRNKENIGFTRLHCGMQTLINGALNGGTQGSAQDISTIPSQTNSGTLGRNLYLPLITSGCEP